MGGKMAAVAALCMHCIYTIGETDNVRLVAVVITERNEKIRVVTAYDLDAGQKRDYLTQRLQEN
jgi:uncharacterized DUF497 family protein